MIKKDEIVQKMMSNEAIRVTLPLLPPLDEFTELLKEIWASKWGTNMGQFHKQLECALAEYLFEHFIGYHPTKEYWWQGKYPSRFENIK